MNDKCSWPGCEDSTGRCIDGELYCSLHYPQKLLEVVKAGMSAGINENGLCEAVPDWLNRFARLVTQDDSLGQNSLSKNKIRSRGFNFSADGQIVRFEIERHPAGCVFAQRWEFNIESGKLNLLSERVVSSEFPIDEEGIGHCPSCGAELNVSPGRVKCIECRFEIQHAHTRDSEQRFCGPA